MDPQESIKRSGERQRLFKGSSNSVRKYLRVMN
jgi:hypothetical protein